MCSTGQKDPGNAFECGAPSRSAQHWLSGAGRGSCCACVQEARLAEERAALERHRGAAHAFEAQQNQRLALRVSASVGGRGSSPELRACLAGAFAGGWFGQMPPHRFAVIERSDMQIDLAREHVFGLESLNLLLGPALRTHRASIACLAMWCFEFGWLVAACTRSPAAFVGLLLGPSWFIKCCPCSSSSSLGSGPSEGFESPRFRNTKGSGQLSRKCWRHQWAHARRSFSTGPMHGHAPARASSSNTTEADRASRCEPHRQGGRVGCTFAAQVSELSWSGCARSTTKTCDCSSLSRS